MSGEKVCERYRWKGKFVKKKVHQQMLKHRIVGQSRKGCKKAVVVEEEASAANFTVKGNRIVDLEYMSNHMDCKLCKARLDIEYIEKETIRGATSIFSIRCSECLPVNTLKTGEEYTNPATGIPVFAINTKLALGAIHTGVSETHLTKFFSILDLPAMDSHTYKHHERIIGPIIEAVAEESCSEATAMERLLTTESLQELKNMLPEHLRDGYLLVKVESGDDDRPIVRIFASFDMGWGQRGNGHTYDSLNGYCALIGLKTGKVLDYCTRNRKCRFCDLELHSGVQKAHDCRKNFVGSAKSMEADGAVALVTNSKILIENNVQVGVFIGDNDSSSISSIQNVIDYPIVQQSDMNHSMNNVGTMLWAIKKSSDPDNELSADLIQHIQRCFSYAVHQNKGNVTGIKNSIENVPYLLFDMHRNCGSWCRSKFNQENTDGIVLKKPNLFDSLLEAFDELSENAYKFVSAASSQANESLNNAMCHKNPKGFLYSTSESTDYRFSATVAEKNYGSSYIQKCLDRSGINHKQILNIHVIKREKMALTKKGKASTPEFKRNRLNLKTKRPQLRYRVEKKEGVTYQSGMSLFDKPQNSKENCVQILDEKVTTLEATNLAIVFFDLETSGLSMKHEILQIRVKFGQKVFKSFFTPTQQMSSSASKINGLTKKHKKLFQYGIEVQTLPSRVVFGKLLEFSQSLPKKCIFVAHNCTFDSSRLIFSFKRLNLLDEYVKVIDGFSDSLALFKAKYPKRANGYKLTTLATELLFLSAEGAHDACYDVTLLEKLCIQYFPAEEIVKSKKSIGDIIQALNNNTNTQKLLPTFSPMNGIITIGMQKQLSSASTSYEQIVTMYKTEGEEKTKSLLQGVVGGKPTIIKSKKILANIWQFSETQV